MKSLFSFLGCFLILTGCAASKPPVIGFHSPEAAFETWRHAAIEMDLNLLVRSYANSARPVIESDLRRTTQEELEKMSQEARRTKFSIERIVFEENLAYLRVRRELNRMQDIEVLTMVKEDNQWKLLP